MEKKQKINIEESCMDKGGWDAEESKNIDKKLSEKVQKWKVKNKNKLKLGR